MDLEVVPHPTNIIHIDNDMNINIHIDINMDIDIHIIINMNNISGVGTTSRSLGCQKGHDYAYFWKHQIDGERNPEPKSCRIKSWARI